MQFPRRSGILMHLTSLPGPYGMGDMGEAAYEFVNFLAATGQSYWQILPLSPTGFGASPYQGLSAFAGNPMLISPQKLAQAGFLSQSDLADVPAFASDQIDYDTVTRYRRRLLHRAYANFGSDAISAQRQSYDQFCREQADWLDDFALFMALEEVHEGRPWYEWERDLMFREPEAIRRAQETEADVIEYQKYLQWQFFQQWLELKRYANRQGIRIIGDIPIFVARDSADVWANTHLFYFDDRLQPTVVSGVPPDYFSETGQLWGHPLYRWKTMAENGYAWWMARFRMAFMQADVVRIDHFRGFYNYWEVPAKEKTAIRGRWRRGPGAKFFRAVGDALGELAIIAEDLGDFDARSRTGVDKLKKRFGFPGMAVLQFAFGGGPTYPFLPHNFTGDEVVYTGTHDNDTTQGWYGKTSTEIEREYVRRYVPSDASEIAWDLIRLAWASVAETAIAPVQDLLSLGHTSRMNTPGTVGPPNWCWRLPPGKLDDKIAARLKGLTETYGRMPLAETSSSARTDTTTSDKSVSD